MVEVIEGSGVFWYPHQRAYCSAFKSWSGYINAAVDIFFSKETLAISNAKGKDKKGKNGEAHKPLTPIIIDALIGKWCNTELFYSDLEINIKLAVTGLSNSLKEKRQEELHWDTNYWNPSSFQCGSLQLTLVGNFPKKWFNTVL